jgi:N-acetylmuramic acid 6-phosphate etherase
MNYSKKITESSSNYDNLEDMSVKELLVNINKEDELVPKAVEKTIPQIEAFVEKALDRMEMGGRLFYIGAGTSGRLGIVDASECPPTFGVDHGIVIGLMAGGDKAMRKAVEFAEDDTEQGWKDLQEHGINDLDSLVGIAASGSTPYVIGALQHANKNGVLTAGITCNPESDLAATSQYPITPIVGPEFVTGSTRMKSGTAQKLILNMISTSIMIGLGRVKGNRMVDMQLSNNKLVDRGTKMVMKTLECGYEEANALLIQHGSVRKAIEAGKG